MFSFSLPGSKDTLDVQILLLFSRSPHMSWNCRALSLIRLRCRLQALPTSLFDCAFIKESWPRGGSHLITQMTSRRNIAALSNKDVSERCDCHFSKRLRPVVLSLCNFGFQILRRLGRLEKHWVFRIPCLKLT